MGNAWSVDKRGIMVTEVTSSLYGKRRKQVRIPILDVHLANYGTTNTNGLYDPIGATSSSLLDSATHALGGGDVKWRYCACFCSSDAANTGSAWLNGYTDSGATLATAVTASSTSWQVTTGKFSSADIGKYISTEVGYATYEVVLITSHSIGSPNDTLIVTRAQQDTAASNKSTEIPIRLEGKLGVMYTTSSTMAYYESAEIPITGSHTYVSMDRSLNGSYSVYVMHMSLLAYSEGK